MHRSDSYWSLLALLGVLLATAGCRSQRGDGHVQISPGPQTFSSEIEPPASRLVADSAGPKVGQRDADGNLILVGAAAPAAKPAPGTTAAVGEAELSEAERAALMEAFRDASPEIRALAEQRLAAHRAKPAAEPAVTAAKPVAEAAAEPAPADPPAAKEVAKPPAAETAAVADAAAEDEKLPTLNDSKPPAAEEKTAETAAADAAAETKLTKDDAADKPIDIRQAVGEGEAEKKEQVKAASATSSTAEAGDGLAAAEPAAVPPAAGDPAAADPLATASEEVLFEQLIARYEKRLQDETRGEVLTGDLVTLRTLITLAGNPDRAVTPVEGWNRSEQEFLNYQMLALWQMVDPQSHPVRGQRWTMALPELRQATNHLAASTGNLDVRGMSFCTEVYGYGQTKPFATDRFTAGQEIILYSELENFVAERLSDGYETHFRGIYEIFDASGERVAGQMLPEDRQLCNNFRRDYFIAYGMHLPSRLTPGNYRLELTMEDMKGKKYGQGSIPLEIIE